MATAKNFSFSIEHDVEIGAYFQFDYNGPDYSEEVWDDLEDIITNNVSTLLDRIEESSYEPAWNRDVDKIQYKLISLGFKWSGIHDFKE